MGMSYKSPSPPADGQGAWGSSILCETPKVLISPDKDGSSVSWYFLGLCVCLFLCLRVRVYLPVPLPLPVCFARRAGRGVLCQMLDLF